MRRSRVSLEQITSLDTLTGAFWRAARGKRQRPDVARFAADLDGELLRLRAGVMSGTIELGQMRSFTIRDPKPRRIHAPCFRERVLHHALMAHVGPVLDRSLVDDTFACRPGKGTLAAVHRAQHHLRRYRWYVQIDVRAYFASIDHHVLCLALRRKLRDGGVVALCDDIVRAYEASPGRGLPIGALTSQHFANYYLGPLDRWVLEQQRVAGMVRYMDDVLAWCHDRQHAREVLAGLHEFAGSSLRLELKPGQIQRSERGVSFLGFGILPGMIRLSRRRRRRYVRARRGIEAAYRAGLVDGNALQAGYAATLVTTAHADARRWRAEQLRREPAVDA
ncbi:MAG: reverse transcriptase/maturase family protein [Deltaproteobacteria bacterium]|nr:reverse transcriptase/maturase family protein [Deltaproteobacteria bacterium]